MKHKTHWHKLFYSIRVRNWYFRYYSVINFILMTVKFIFRFVFDYISVCVWLFFKAVTWPHTSLCAQMSDGTQHNYMSNSPNIMSLTKTHYLLPKLMLNFTSSFKSCNRAFLNIKTFCLAMWNYSVLSLLWKNAQFKIQALFSSVFSSLLLSDSSTPSAHTQGQPTTHPF